MKGIRKIRLILKNFFSIFSKSILFFVLSMVLIFSLHGTLNSSNSFDSFKDKLGTLIEATKSREKARSLKIEYMRDVEKAVDSNSPIWPIQSFLLAEIYRIRNESKSAKDQYRKLVRWTLNDPYKDNRGGSSLGVIAYWRLLQCLNKEENPVPKDIMEIIHAKSELIQMRSAKGIFQVDMLESLPQIEEDILRLLVSLAWKIGEKEMAVNLFFNFLQVARLWDFTPVEKKILDMLIEDKQTTPERIKLFLGKRLETLKSFKDAEQMLSEALKSDDFHVSTEAGLHLADLKYNVRAPRQEIMDLLEDVIENGIDDEVIQEALLLYAKAYIRRGSEKNPEKFKEMLLRLIKEFPEGSLVNDALNQLASYYQNINEYEESLSYFKQLREHKGPGEKYRDSAYMKPVLILFKRALQGDLDKAIELLKDMEEKRPFGDLYLMAQFWMGRVYEEVGNTEKAQEYFNKVISKGPYDYYGVRSLMHLNNGAKAKTLILPDEITLKEIKSRYRKSLEVKASNTLDNRSSPYHERLNFLIETDLYKDSMDIINHLRSLYPSKRIEDINLSQMDQSFLFSQICLFFSFRQDVLGAIEALPTSENRLRIAELIGRKVNDWPIVMKLVISGVTFDPVKAQIQKDPIFLATAYPKIYDDLLMKKSKTYRVKPELLYSIIRNESAFYPAALSTDHAYGLFQFIPDTFRALDKKYHLLTESGKSSMEEYFLDKDLCIDLGGRWIRDLLNNNDNNILYAIMEHVSGASAVRRFKTVWEAHGERFNDDYEYQIETAEYFEARIFGRVVIRDLAIVESSGIFKD